MFYRVYGYGSKTGEEHIVEFPDQPVSHITYREEEAYDQWGYSIGEYETLDEAMAAYPAAKVHLLCTDELDNHRYTTRTCPHCHNEFCWNCCKSTNVHWPTSRNPYMYCPVCGRDVMR